MSLPRRIRTVVVPFALSVAANAVAQPIPFTADRWDLSTARVVEHLGRQALTGSAVLRDVVFRDGVIEVDVAMRAGARAYPGILFRIQDEGVHERVYLRPHRSPLYADAVQYVAASHGMDSWQLYNGPGFTAPAVIPTDRWVHLRLEVRGGQARVFLDSAPAPALVVWELDHGEGAGALGLNAGPAAGAPAAFFSDFQWRPADGLDFGPPPASHAPPGFVREWEVSAPVPRRTLDFDRYPADTAGAGPWTPLHALPRGVLDISRVHGRSLPEPEAVIVRTTLRAERDGVRRFQLGYSDEVSLFVNGRFVFAGTSAYGGRDPSFLGVVGPFDVVPLELRRGENEVLALLGEASGGWALMLRDAAAVLEAPGLTRRWTSEPVLRVPESAAYDPRRNAVYVSNYDGYYPSGGAGRQAISKFSADGAVEALAWVTGLNNPTGLAVVGDRLYAVEARALVEIDIPGAAIVRRYPAEGAAFLNDVAVAPDGAVYVSDSRGGAIFRLAGDRLEEWLRTPAVSAPNGIHVRDGRLIVGVNGDHALKAVDLATRAVTVIATLHRGIIDGVSSDADGRYLVSYNEGMLLRVSPAGEVTTLLDLTATGTNIADFDYAPSAHLLVFPTFLDNRVILYRLE